MRGKVTLDDPESGDPNIKVPFFDNYGKTQLIWQF